MSDSLELIMTREEEPALVLRRGEEVFRMNSAMRPTFEAQRWAAQYDGLEKKSIVCMFGLGTGLFAEQMLDKLGADGRLIVCEPSEAIFTDFLNEVEEIPGSAPQGQTEAAGQSGAVSEQTKANGQTTGTPEQTKANGQTNGTQGQTESACNRVKARLAKLALGEQVIICDYSEAFTQILVQYVSYYSLKTMTVCCHPQYDRAYPSEYAGFLHRINENRERLIVNKNTLVRFRDSASRNVISNLPMLRSCNMVDELKKVVRPEVPVIIVSAGPSLDKNIDELKRAKGHSLIFAVDTALKYLMEHDIMPDLAITVEPIKPMSNYEDDRCFDVPSIFDCESNNEIVSRQRARQFLYNCRDYVKELLNRAGYETGTNLASGGSVATAAFAVCEMLQTQHIILIGQDLAYSGEATHAGKVVSKGINDSVGYEMVEDIYGNEVRTRIDWIGYLRWFEDEIARYKAGLADRNVTGAEPVIDATEGGAKIRGTVVMTLSEAIDLYCSGIDYDFAKELAKLPPFLDKKGYARVCDLMEQSRSELAKVAETAEKAAADCRKVLELTDLHDDLNGATHSGSTSGQNNGAANEGSASGQKNGAANNACEEVEKELSASIAGARRLCESALLYPLINNYCVSEIVDEVGRIRARETGIKAQFMEQELAFEAIVKACRYFETVFDGKN